MRSKFLFLMLACLLASSSIKAEPQPPSSRQQIQTFINLLDYIKKDYPNAVKDGKVISPSEYQEMLGFSRQIKSLHQQLADKLNNPDFSALQQGVDQLKVAVAQKASAQQIASLAGTVRRKVLALHLIKVTPPYWPDIEKGKALFATHCQSCHGVHGAGDGPLAQQLDPQPTNFTDSTVANNLSPLQAYNTVRLGIEGTGMRSFTELSDQQAWNIAFYVNTLSYRDSVSTAARKKIKDALSDTLNLEALATLPNKQWESFFHHRDINTAAGMRVLRSVEQGSADAQKDPLAIALQLLHQSSESYQAGNTHRASSLALNAYLKGVEPMEAQIKASDPDLVSEIETNMFAVRSVIKDKKSRAVLAQHIKKASVSIKKAQDVLHEQDYSFWFTFIISASILLREGLEAFLIIMVILSVLKSVGAERSTKYVHGGWLLALGLGIISWFFTETLIQMGSFQREFMEGIGSLIAVAMLLYIGFWLHNKTYASQWTKFVKEKIHRLLDENNRWGLAFLAFVVVFREAFESVIFFSSISIKSSGAGNSGIFLGSASAIIVVLLLGVLLIKFSKNLPIKSLFKYSSMVMAVLAVILIGKGIHAFQEAGYLSVQGLPVHFNLPLFGIYPTLQTIVAQLVIIGSIFALYYYGKRLAMKASAR